MENKKRSKQNRQFGISIHTNRKGNLEERRIKTAEKNEGSQMSYLKMLERKQRRMERKLAENANELQEESLMAAVMEAARIVTHTEDITFGEIQEFYRLVEKVTDRRFQPAVQAAKEMVTKIYGGLPCMEKE